MTAIENIIQTLKLEKHVEGGYYRRTFCSTLDCTSHNGKKRQTMSSIYYLITRESGFSALCVNDSDLILYHHQGSPMKIVFFDPASNELYSHILGSDIKNGEQPQVVCPGGIWKAYDLMGGDYCLVSEAVSPSFEYDDMHLVTQQNLASLSNEMQQQLMRYLG